MHNLICSITYNLGKRQMFNHQLSDMEHRYTYFVPRDHAWHKFQLKHPSAYNALFKEDFGYYVSMHSQYRVRSPTDTQLEIIDQN